MTDQKKEELLERVRAIMPDLEIQHVERNQEGLMNDILVINNQYVFRFARTEMSGQNLAIETQILDLLRPRLSISVPTPVYRSSDTMVYPLLTGHSLSREILLGLNEDAQNDLARQLGAFLQDMHTTTASGPDWDLPLTRAPVTRERWLDIRQRVQERVYPLMLKHQIEWAESLLDSALDNPEFFEYEPSLIHGDLAPYHILCDPMKGKITGVIDFGVAGMGDPASDFGSLIGVYGESFVARMQPAYFGLEELMPRARFYAQSIELQLVLLGIETGEAFWFAAHLGGARDIQSGRAGDGADH